MFADQGSAGILGPLVWVGLFGLFLGLVTGTGATGRAHGATDDRTRRSGDRTTDDCAGDAAAESAGSRAGSVIAFGRLARKRATDGADRATDDRTRGATDGHADGRAAEGTRSGAHGLVAVLLVLDGRAVSVDRGVVRTGRVIPVGRVVHVIVRHSDISLLRLGHDRRGPTADFNAIDGTN